MHYLIITIATIVALLNIILGILVWLKRASLTNIVFAIFAISVGLWIFSMYIPIIFSNPLFFGRLAFSVSIISITSLVIFAYIFLEKRNLKLKEYFLFLIFPIFFLITSFTNILVKSATVENYHLIGTFGIAYTPYRFFVIIYILLTIILLTKKYLHSKNLDKLRIKYVLFGIGLPITLALFTNLILPGFFSIRELNSLGPLLSIFIIGSISYAIVRHQLLDIKIIIQRGLIYSTLLSIIVALYLFLVFVLGYLFQKTTDITILLSAGLTAIVGIFGVPILEKYFRRITDKIFFKDKYDYSESLQELSEILDKSLDLQRILTESSTKLQKILRVKTAKITIGEKTGQEILDTPIITENQHIGIISIGEKLSGDLFTKEDLKLLKTFALEAGVAFRRVELYEEVKKHARELEEKVEDRTAEIRRMQETQKQMMIDVSHNLQTPLTIIKGEIELLQKQVPESRQLKIVDKSINRVSKFIYDLLSLAKLETNNEEFTKENINLSELLDEIVEYLKVLAEKKDIEIIDGIEPGIFIYGNKNKLEELVTNLASNSIKYISNNTEKKVHFKLWKDGHVHLIVKDNGIGIKKEELQNIFERFYRTKRGGGKSTKGIGLGLAICKKIVEKHGGTIRVESELGKGSEFIVQF